MSRIITQGVAETDRVYHAQCESCETVFEFEGREIGKPDTRGRQFTPCASCKKPHWVVHPTFSFVGTITRVK
jgi:NAD-dependent SIR2 family protein deacetylase